VCSAKRVPIERDPKHGIRQMRAPSPDLARSARPRFTNRAAAGIPGSASVPVSNWNDLASKPSYARRRACTSALGPCWPSFSSSS
jgi:hypothetical protein